MHNKVLIVEDDIDIVELLRLYLESSNYITSAASDGLMALDILKKEKIIPTYPPCFILEIAIQSFNKSLGHHGINIIYMDMLKLISQKSTM